MNEQLQQALYDKYPVLFGQKDMPMTMTAMCWGIDVGDGWYNIVDCLCAAIDDHAKTLEQRAAAEGDPPVEPIQFVQVKEKFGSLRVYTNYSDDVIEALVYMAEKLSAKTCEKCGNPAKTTRRGTWYRTLCEPCAHEFEEARKNERY